MTSVIQRVTRPPAASVREAPFRLRATDTEGGDGLTLDGYGAVFNRLTVIDSWEGRFREQIASGAMKKSFRETPPKIQFDHGRHPTIGSIPIAELKSVAEESDPQLAPAGGAHIVARLFNNWLIAPVRDAIAAGAIDGMSFRFEMVTEAWTYADGKPIRDDRQLMDELMRCMVEGVPDDQLPIRTLKQLKVPEMGPVVWPAYTETSVGVRSIIDLGQLASNPADPDQQKLVARAVFLLESAQPKEPEGQQVTEQADKHPEVSDDAQRSTDIPSAGEHPSKPRGRRAVDIMLRRSRDVLLNIDQKGFTP